MDNGSWIKIYCLLALPVHLLSVFGKLLQDLGIILSMIPTVWRLSPYHKTFILLITSLETFYFSPSNNDSTVATNVNCGVSNCSSCALHVLPDISWGTLDFPPHDYPILSGSSLSAESFPLSTHFNSVSPGYKMSTLITIVMMVTMMKAKMVQPSQSSPNAIPDLFICINVLQVCSLLKIILYLSYLVLSKPQLTIVNYYAISWVTYEYQ